MNWEQVDVIHNHKVPHACLFSKLEFYGIRGRYLEWIKKFLNDRKQQVVIDNKFSDPSTVISGVPQGSVLGPLLFQLFINDLPIANGIQSLVKLYADDVLIMRSITTPDDHQILQNDLIKYRSSTWQMPFNLAKCEHLSVTNKPYPSIYHYKINELLYRELTQ